MAEQTLNRAWLVLAVVLLLFIMGIFIDRMIAAVVPTYVGVFEHARDAFIPAADTSLPQ
ncbi:MAG: hypothetical protein V1895_01190 [Parcubacteria group bacterium]